MSDDTFGFGGAKRGPLPAPTEEALKEKLDTFRPKPPAAEIPIEAVDRVAERRGFKSREAAPASDGRRRKGEAGPFVAINTRAPVRVADPFIAWCEKERYSYWQGIEELMRRAGLLK
jgi:hypothetical protein